MPSSPPQTRLPTPVSAYLGLLATAVDGTKAAVRTAPLRAIQLPLRLAADVVSLRAHVLGRYAELAERGDEVVARLRGEAPAPAADTATTAYADELAAVTISAADRWRAAGPADTTNGQADWAGLSGLDADGADATALGIAPLGAGPRDLEDDAAAALAETPTVAPQTGPSATADDPAPAAADELGIAETALDAALLDAALLDAATADEPTADEPAAADEPALSPTLLPADAVPADAVGATPVPSADELPLPDFDHMTLGSLRGRLRRLDVGSLEQLVAYEQAHGNRLPILTMLENRIEKLRADGEG